MLAREHISTHIFDDNEAASKYVAEEIAALIQQRQKEGRRCVLGLATGSTPRGIYSYLVQLHLTQGLSFHNVTTFNLDEYYPIAPRSLQSYHRFMKESLFDLVDLSPEMTHLPPGDLPRDKLRQACEEYERLIQEAGGIDLQLLGIGHSGHIGFNELGSLESSTTRLVSLHPSTRLAAASDFFSLSHVPHEAITMGISTIFSAKRIILVALGEGKASAVGAAVEGQRGSYCPASFLQGHPQAEIVVDTSAAAQLTRVKAPWTLGDEFNWGNHEESEKNSRDQSFMGGTARGWRLQMQAVIWLSQRCKKPIACLSTNDYLENGLGQLLATEGSPEFSPEALNSKVVAALQNTITRDPVTFALPSTPLENSNNLIPASNGQDEHKRRVLIFSPHPDDDMISMGGMLRLLCSQAQHEVHVAYQTTGCIAVRDEDVLQRLDFAQGLLSSFGSAKSSHRSHAAEPPGTLNPLNSIEHLRNLIQSKHPGDPDPPELQKVKALVRRCEATAAATDCGVSPTHLHFLELPFYRTGTVLKAPATARDYEIVGRTIQEMKPSVIFAAGDLSDPHGTHRTCLSLILQCLSSLKASLRPFPRVFMYRGAWQEWSLHEVDAIVPLTVDEVERKTRAICMHQSQKDPPPFPGVDTREFWERAKSRNEATAATLTAPGLPAMAAAEAFVEVKLKEGKWVRK